VYQKSRKNLAKIPQKSKWLKSVQGKVMCPNSYTPAARMHWEHHRLVRLRPTPDIIVHVPCTRSAHGDCYVLRSSFVAHPCVSHTIIKVIQCVIQCVSGTFLRREIASTTFSMAKKNRPKAAERLVMFFVVVQLLVVTEFALYRPLFV
jgi:hypothetical protein